MLWSPLAFETSILTCYRLRRLDLGPIVSHGFSRGRYEAILCKYEQ
jgi:hypothetical protein